MIIFTNAGCCHETILGKFLAEILIYSFKNMHLKMLSAKWLPFCLSLNV